MTETRKIINLAHQTQNELRTVIGIDERQVLGSSAIKTDKIIVRTRKAKLSVIFSYEYDGSQK